MERLVKGDVVVIPFPFSDLSASKRRPALVVADLGGNDVILCQITSVARNDRFSIPLTRSDFNEGKLKLESRIRPNRLFTADRSIIEYKAGTLTNEKVKVIEQTLIDIFTK
ncbi:MAG TPA: type II toxin-antitoxin system PemK/MazF family toxin [Methanosarcinaceae archaeon]|nr:type II toxin-antitoxin system PemK/MazF family toxin [Methanosarcinaceae archaeon]